MKAVSQTTISDSKSSGGSTNDPQRLRIIYKQGFPSVRAYVLNNSGSEADAKDVFQESLINAWMNEKEGKYQETDASSIEAYIFTIAKRKWLDKLRSKSHRSTIRLVKEDVEDQLAENADLNEIDIEYLTTLYSKLDDKCQVLLKKFYFEKKSMREIAEELEVDEGSVRTMKYRCVMKLRKMHLASEE